MKVSLKTKTIALIIVVMLFVGIATMICFYKGINDIITDQYSDQVVSLARSVALNVNSDNVQAVRDAVMEIYDSIPQEERFSDDMADEPGFEEYHYKYASVTRMPEYQMLLTQLQKTMEEIHVYDVCIGWGDKESKAFVYLADATTDPDYFAPPGSFGYLEEYDWKTLDAPGLGFAPDITKTEEYGWIIAAAMPIYDKNFHVTGFVEVDVNMDDVAAQMFSYLRITGALLAIILIITILSLIRIVDRSIVDPINKLADAAARYSGSGDPGDGERVRFADIDINTHDEIEELAQSMAQMERDIDDYIASLTETRTQLNTTTEYARKMDRIAYIDALTGVRNKRAYGDALIELRIDIEQGNADFGIAVVDLNYLKLINDTYGHEKGDIAIRSICDIICESFKHSPVFRYGGDEFAVILEGHDLRFVDTQIAEMKKTMAELQTAEDLDPWQKVSAAVGYAVYDPAIDKNVDSVFKRADKAMYEDKTSMKRSFGFGSSAV